MLTEKHFGKTKQTLLPRREYTKRSDYNITLRRNKHLIVEEGWIHDQDNDKIIREKRKDDFVTPRKGSTPIQELMMNVVKVQYWWEENKTFWALVRASWANIYGKNKDLKLDEKVDGKRLYEILFSMPTTTDKETILKTLKSFVK